MRVIELIICWFRGGECQIFHRTQDLNRWLVQNSIITKDNNVYHPMSNYEDLFIVDRYRGRVKGIKFRHEFLGWIEGNLKSNGMVQGGLFSMPMN